MTVSIAIPAAILVGDQIVGEALLDPRAEGFFRLARWKAAIAFHVEARGTAIEAAPATRIIVEITLDNANVVAAIDALVVAVIPAVRHANIVVVAATVAAGGLIGLGLAIAAAVVGLARTLGATAPIGLHLLTITAPVGTVAATAPIGVAAAAISLHRLAALIATALVCLALILGQGRGADSECSGT